MLDQPGPSAPLTRRQLRLERELAERAAVPPVPPPAAPSAPPAASWTSPSDEARRLAQYAFTPSPSVGNAFAPVPRTQPGKQVGSGPARPTPRRLAPSYEPHRGPNPSATAARMAHGSANPPAPAGRAGRDGRTARQGGAGQFDIDWAVPLGSPAAAMSDQVATHDTPAFHAGVRDALDEHLSGMSFGQPDHDGEPDWGAAGYAIRQQVPQPDLVWTHGGRSSVPVELGFTGLPGSAGTAGSPGTADSPGTVGSPGMGSTNWTIQSTSSPLAPTLDATPPPEVQRRTSGPDGLDQLTDSEIPGEQEATPVGWSAFEAGRETLVALAGRLRGLVRRHNQRFAAAAGVILLSGAAFIGLSGSASHSARDGDDALTPLAQAIEAVSRRNLAQLTSRSMTAQLVEAAQVDPVSSETEISADPRSNVGLVLTWDVSALEASPGAQLILRRGVGDAPPLTPAEGVDVALGDDPGVVQDLGLQPDTAYSYTLFIQRPGEKPEVLGRLVATTSRFPTELLPGQSLVAGERLTSATHTHYLAVDQTGAVVLYNNLNQKLWSLDADPDPSASLMLNGDGELIVAVGELVKWRADASAPGAQLVLADTGALQLIGADGEVVWTSHNAGYQLRGGDSPYAVSSDGWTQPGAGPVSSPFGMRSHPIYGSARMHQGVDMTNGRGHPIYAAHDGLVTKVHTDSGGNWTVEIDHGRNILTRYLHMDGLGAILVKEGDRVVAGEQIGRTGSSGQTTGPHLHFEVSVDGETTDPVAFLKQHGVTIK